MGEIIGTHSCSPDCLMCVFVVLGWSAATYWVRVKWCRVIDLVSIVATTAAVSVVLNLPVHVSQRAHATRLSLRDVLRCRPVSSAAATSVTRAFCLSRDSVNYRRAARDAGHMYVCCQLLSRVVLIISVWRQLFSAALCQVYININTWTVYTSESEPAGLASRFCMLFSLFFLSQIISLLTCFFWQIRLVDWTVTASLSSSIRSTNHSESFRVHIDEVRISIAWMRGCVSFSVKHHSYSLHMTYIFKVMSSEVNITDHIS